MQTTNQIEVQTPAKTVGRPRSNAHTRVVYLHPDTLEQRAVGKPKAGTTWVKATIQWSEEYVNGKTQILSQETVVAQKQKPMQKRAVVAPVSAVEASQPVSTEPVAV